MKNLFLILILFSVIGLQAQQKTETLVLIKTSKGDITAKLYNDTPGHRDNFIKLIKQGWYAGSPFHRVINNFMIQGGGNSNGKQDPGYTIDAEILPKYIHKKGALAAARMGDNVNPERKSSGSQFYIVQGQKYDANTLNMMSSRNGLTYTDEQKQLYATQGGTPHLDGAYTVFGEVVSGFEVIDAIAAVQTGRADRPLEEITMQIEVLE
ncbi:MAG: peptidylprolyl isomerase [Bacteroidetes bacterium]|jgi:cyclophilin family peptidyl-prolyl cis-trans isomerase|nr:peptidylprolyl isomerase [Bacteroidota bacterium]